MSADYETDAIIQESLRKEVAKDVTLLTIAHRLQTIMDSDKIVSHFFTAHMFCATLIIDAPVHYSSFSTQAAS